MAEVQVSARRARQFIAEFERTSFCNCSLGLIRECVFYKAHPHAAEACFRAV
jgi:hypothetical protein